MITYLYWGAVIALAMVLLVGLGKYNFWRAAMLGSLTVLLIGWAAYYFHFQQVFVKKYGGVMSITVPDGQQHIAATWKDEHLWIENYDPNTNTCHFNEYSKGNVLQGKVNIKNCNPLRVNDASRPMVPVAVAGSSAPQPAAQ